MVLGREGRLLDVGTHGRGDGSDVGNGEEETIDETRKYSMAQPYVRRRKGMGRRKTR